MSVEDVDDISTRRAEYARAHDQVEAYRQRAEDLRQTVDTARSLFVRSNGELPPIECLSRATVFEQAALRYFDSMLNTDDAS